MKKLCKRVYYTAKLSDMPIGVASEYSYLKSKNMPMSAHDNSKFWGLSIAEIRNKYGDTAADYVYQMLIKGVDVTKPSFEKPETETLLDFFIDFEEKQDGCISSWLVLSPSELSSADDKRKIFSSLAEIGEFTKDDIIESSTRNFMSMLKTMAPILEIHQRIMD